MKGLRFFRIFDNERCPCGSELTFRNCCKGKSGELSKENKLPLEVQVMQMMKNSLQKYCLHPDQKNCKKPIKNAHALQNNKIISLLAGNERHVYTMSANQQPRIEKNKVGVPEVIVEFKKTSANKATTSTCFCDRHDNIVFAAIEKGAPSFDKYNEEMKFVYAYKAFIFEYYKAQESFKIFQKSFKRCPLAFKNILMVMMYRMQQLDIEYFDSVKAHFDEEIMANTHNGVETVVIEIPEQIKFACFAFIAPLCDLNGKKIKHTSNNKTHRLAITIFPENSRSYIILSCLKKERAAYNDFFNQLKSERIDKIKYYFSLILPLYSENIVLSPELWNQWDEDIKKTLVLYSNISNHKVGEYATRIKMHLKNVSKNQGNFDYKLEMKFGLFK